MFKIFKKLFFPIALISLLLLGCNNNVIDKSVSLEFSSDTIIFDTVFTTIGSSTRIMKVYNRNDYPVTISNIVVEGGDNSCFSINVDGVSGSSVEDVEILADDSIYIFAKVRIDPNNVNSPLIVEDSICFLTEDSRYYVKLIAWGQDANYILADTYVDGLPPYKIVAAEGETVVWAADKPYVVYGYAVVDSTGQLIIQAGAHIHFHSSGGLWVYKGGSIQVMGTATDKVVFQGDRLENDFADIPEQWEKIWLCEGSINNEFHHTVIKNGYIGLHVQTYQESMGNILILDNVEIYNMSGMGIYSVFYGIVAGNCVISNCGSYLAALTGGGYYDFRHCTFANYWSKSTRQNASVFVSDYYINNNNMYLYNLENAYFGNCIIYGKLDNEVMYDKQGSGMFGINLQNSLLKISDEYINDEYFSDCIFNKDPLIYEAESVDFSLDTIASPAVNAGNISVINKSPVVDVHTDHLGYNRDNDDAPDIGAYEFIPDKK